MVSHLERRDARHLCQPRPLWLNKVKVSQKEQCAAETHCGRFFMILCGLYCRIRDMKEASEVVSG